MENDLWRDWSGVYEALSHDTRRRLVQHVVGEPAGPAAIDGLAERLPGHDDDRALLRLRHVHLPKLEAANIVVWDRDDGAVVPTPFARTLPTALYDPSTAPGTTLTAVEADD